MIKINNTWKTLNDLKNMNTPITLESNVTLDSNGVEVISIPFNHSSILIKSIRLIPSKEGLVTLNILDSSSENADSLYFNTSEYDTGSLSKGIYDMVDIIHKDTNNEGKLYLKVENQNSYSLSVDIKIKCLVLK